MTESEAIRIVEKRELEKQRRAFMDTHMANVPQSYRDKLGDDPLKWLAEADAIRWQQFSDQLNANPINALDQACAESSAQAAPIPSQPTAASSPLMVPADVSGTELLSHALTGKAIHRRMAAGDLEKSAEQLLNEACGGAESA